MINLYRSDWRKIERNTLPELNQLNNRFFYGMPNCELIEHVRIPSG